MHVKFSFKRVFSTSLQIFSYCAVSQNNVLRQRGIFGVEYSYILFRRLLFSPGLRRKESACNAGDLGSIRGLRSSSGEGNGYPLQYSYLENAMDR